MNNNDEIVRLAEQRVGTLIRDKYRVDRVLGIGGMAVVYAATHRNEKTFAIKMLHAHLSVHGDIKARFLREGRAANLVKHPGAVAVVDDDIADDGSAFLVMELIDGTGVEELWESRGSRLDSPLVLALADQVLAVLEMAHERGIVHRDIKPANLFVAREGIVKVLDFGIARLWEAASAQATQTGMMLGTPAFMAPEQALGRSKEVDARSDLWAVGATMFTLLSGEFVQVGETAQEMLVRAATQPARSLAAVLPGAPPALVALVDRATAFDKANRFASATEMRAATAEAFEALTGSGLHAGPIHAVFGRTGSQASLEGLRAMRPSFTSSPDGRPSFAGTAGGPPRVTPVAERRPSHGTLPLSPASPADGTAPTMAGPPRSASLGTVEPVAASERLPLPVSGPPIAVIAFVALGVAVAASVVGALTVFGPHADHPVVAAPSPGTSATVSRSAAPSASPDAVPSDLVIAPLATTPPPGATPTRRHSAAPASRPSAGSSLPASSTVPRSAPPPPTAAATAATPPSNCTPNFTLDADGHKHFKPECFAQ